MRHYLGLDAGGTKTHCLVANERGDILGFGAAGSGNYECLGIEPAATENRKAVQTALAEAQCALQDISSIGMGIAGADLPEDYDMLEREIYTPLFGATRRTFRNDSMAGLRGGTRHPSGIVIACGTGCVCAGRSRSGQEVRVGGLGDKSGDECTGSEIGRIALRRVWQAREGIIPPTILTDKFVARAECAHVDDLFYRMYRGQLDERALEPMAKLVFDAALEGDAASCDILEHGGRYLGMMVNAAARSLGVTQEAFEVVMAGSVFKGSSPILIDAMRTAIHRVSPHAALVMPLFEPVVGALLMGMDMDGAVTDEVYDNLARSLGEAEKRYHVRLKAE